VTLTSQGRGDLAVFSALRQQVDEHNVVAALKPGPEEIAKLHGDPPQPGIPGKGRYSARRVQVRKRQNLVGPLRLN